MSPIIRTALEGEETSKTEAMMQTLRQSLHLERQRQERQRRLVMQHAALAGSHRALVVGVMLVRAIYIKMVHAIPIWLVLLYRS